MIRKLLVGAVLGFIGKKLYDQGTLDPYIARAREAFDQAQAPGGNAGPADARSSQA